jgi:hypothetical protein
MSRKYLFISTLLILATFAIGWETAVNFKKHRESTDVVTLAIPVIRYDRFDEARNALIIGLFNPGTLPMEISRTELIYEANHAIASTDLAINDYDDKPLVLDPGDTILVPLRKSDPLKTNTATGSYWGHLVFRIPGQVDYYSVHHRFSAHQIGDVNNPVK